MSVSQVTVAAGTVKSQLAKWGATIRTRSGRREGWRAGAGRAAGAGGRARRVGRGGGRGAAAVNRSSGHPALDAAALAAVQKAGRFPAAPAELAKPSYAFSISVKFSR